VADFSASAMITAMLAIEEEALSLIDPMWDWDGHTLQNDRVLLLKKVAAAIEARTGETEPAQ
jgi:hypothetical protein